jgi:protein-S-isoprenylcysteine O-methyltransferase Ste14
MQILLFLIGSVLLLLFSYIVFRVLLRNDYLIKGRTTWITITLETLVFALHANFSYIFIPAKWPDLPLMSLTTIQNFIAFSLFWIGIITTVMAMINLGYKRVFGYGDDQLRQTGFYRFSRNPQILTYGLALVGVGLFWPSWYALAWILLYVPIAHLMVITEEEYMTKLHGEKYEQYCRQVPRYLFI